MATASVQPSLDQMLMPGIVLDLEGGTPLRHLSVYSWDQKLRPAWNPITRAVGIDKPEG
jgi:hypothetical protein